jgi:hypothetical protein
VKIEEIIMTPALAVKILEGNTRNRKLSRAHAAAFTAIIERGEWIFDGNPIKVDENGEVTDGQHRLRGIAGADTSGVPMLLITGLPASSRKVVDCGRARTFADYLEIESVPNSQSIAAAVRGIWNYDNGLYDWHGDWMKRPIPSVPQLWGVYEKRRAEIEEAISHANRVIRVVRVSRASAAVAWMVLGNVECERCGPAAEDREEFYAQLAMLGNGPVSDGTMAFIRLMNGRGGQAEGSRRVGYTQTDQLALMFKAWNAYREGKPVQLLWWRRGGKAREEFPVPH